MNSVLGAGPVQHFTDAAGVQGITGLNPAELEAGQTAQVQRLTFGYGSNSFLAGEEGDLFVTEIGLNATAGQIQKIGVFGDKQSYVIQFSRESAFANNIRLSPVFPARSIFSIPAGTILDHAEFYYTVTRVQ